MIRNEIEIVYASLAKFILEYPDLPAGVKCKFDYEPFEVQEEKVFPIVGIRKVSDVSAKRLDKHAEYCQTEKDGIVYSWTEIGVFTLSCTVALFMDFNEVNPIPYLRSWYSDIKRRAIKHVRIPALDEDIPNEHLKININGSPFEKSGERLFSLKFTVEIEGKMLDYEIARPQTAIGDIDISV